MPADPNEVARKNFVHLCHQFQQMGKLLEGMAWHIPTADSKAGKHLASIIDQHHQMGEQLKIVCGELEGMVNNLLAQTPPPTRSLHVN